MHFIFVYSSLWRENDNCRDHMTKKATVTPLHVLQTPREEYYVEWVCK